MHEMTISEEVIWHVLELMDTYKAAIINQHTLKELVEFKCLIYHNIFRWHGKIH
jgi:hypothetical protein